MSITCFAAQRTSLAIPIVLQGGKDSFILSPAPLSIIPVDSIGEIDLQDLRRWLPVYPDRVRIRCRSPLTFPRPRLGEIRREDGLQRKSEGKFVQRGEYAAGFNPTPERVRSRRNPRSSEMLGSQPLLCKPSSWCRSDPPSAYSAPTSPALMIKMRWWGGERRRATLPKGAPPVMGDPVVRADRHLTNPIVCHIIG